jgi:hypothetical protein
MPAGLLVQKRQVTIPNGRVGRYLNRFCELLYGSIQVALLEKNSA